MTVVLADAGISTVAHRLLERAVGEVRLLPFGQIRDASSASVLVVLTLEQLMPEQVDALWHLLVRRRVGQLWLISEPFTIARLPPSLVWISGRVAGLRAHQGLLPDGDELRISIRTAFRCPLGKPLVETIQPAALAAWSYHPTSNSGELIMSSLELLRYSPFTHERDRERVLRTLMARLLARVKELEPFASVDGRTAVGPHLDDSVLNAVTLAAAIVVEQGHALTLENLREALRCRMAAPMEDIIVEAGLEWLQEQSLEPVELVATRGLEPFLRRYAR